MNANDVNQVIDNLCEKLGMGVESVAQLIPILARYKIAVDTIWAIVLAIGFIIGVMMFRKGMKSHIERKGFIYDDDMEFIMIFLGITIIVICGVAFIAVVEALIGWIFAPEIQAIDYIRGLVK